MRTRIRNFRDYVLMSKKHVIPAGVAFLLAAVVVPAYLSRKPPIQLLGIRIAEQSVVQGDKLKLVYGYRVLEEGCDTFLHVAVYDNTEQVRMYSGPIEESLEQPEDAGPEIYSGIVKYVGVPLHSQAGSGTIQVYAECRCNWLHNYWPIIQELGSIEFTIKEKVDIKTLQDQIEKIEKIVPELDKLVPNLNTTPQSDSLPGLFPKSVPDEPLPIKGNKEEEDEKKPLLPVQKSIVRKRDKGTSTTTKNRTSTTSASASASASATTQPKSSPKPSPTMPSPSPIPESIESPKKPQPQPPLQPEYEQEELPNWAKSLLGYKTGGKQ